MPLKLPGIDIDRVRGFEKGRIRQPNYAALGTAVGAMVSDIGMALIQDRDVDTQLSAATGEAAKELSSLRAKLETSNTIPVNEVPDGLLYEQQLDISDGEGVRKEIGRPFVFAHEVASDWWDQESDVIVKSHAATIKNKEARAKFTEEMATRYVAPGSLAIGKASIIRQRAHGQASSQLRSHP